MIVDTLANAPQYASLHRRFAAGFEFLRRADLANLPDGKHEISGDDLFAIVARDAARGRVQSPLEVHRKYIDIQYVVAGTDAIGYLPLAGCRRVSSPYDAERDLECFYDRPPTWLTLTAGMFAIFFPHDAHAPLAGDGEVHKVVVKVAVE